MPSPSRVRRELLATGETVRKRTVETLDELTPQERQIAQRAADGQTNADIGARLFLSPRTVEWHLRKVFGKLGITSRRKLRSALSRAAPPARTAVPPCVQRRPDDYGVLGACCAAVFHRRVDLRRAC